MRMRSALLVVFVPLCLLWARSLSAQQPESPGADVEWPEFDPVWKGDPTLPVSEDIPYFLGEYYSRAREKALREGKLLYVYHSAGRFVGDS